MISEFQRRILPENKKFTHVLSLLKTKVPEDSEITSVIVEVSLINLMHLSMVCPRMGRPGNPPREI